MAESNSVSFWWIVAFLLLALGVGVVAVYAVGGTLIDSGLLLPFLP